MKDVQKGRKSWLERLTSPPEDSEDNEQYDDQTQAFHPFPTDDGRRDRDADDERPDEHAGQDYSPEHGRRPEQGQDPERTERTERPAFGAGPHQQGARVAGVEGRQPDDFDAAFAPRGLRTPPSDFRTGPLERARVMGRSAQAPGPFRPDAGDTATPERHGFRRNQPGTQGEPAWGGEPPHTTDGGAFGRHGADRPETGRREADRPEANRPDVERPDLVRQDTDQPDTDRPDTDRPATDEDTGLGGKPQGDAPADREQEVGEVAEGPFTGRAESPEADGRERDDRFRHEHDSASAEEVPARDHQDGPDISDSQNESDREAVLALPDRSAGPNDSLASEESARRPGDRAQAEHDDVVRSDRDLAEVPAGDTSGTNAPATGRDEWDAAERRRRIDDLQQRWLDAQAKLLDDPRDAAHEAGLLVGEAMVFVTSTFTEHRDRIERDWRDDADLGTDELLSIMRRYRSLFRSVLAASELPEDRR
ncbi:hypothetical protein ACWDWO_11465 [Actinopolymorpha singaporensis]